MLTQRSVLTQRSILTERSFLNDGTAQSRVEDALARLSGEDSELSKHLLDAAVAGASSRDSPPMRSFARKLLKRGTRSGR